MLEYLHIRNLALIEDMALEFSSGMNVLTGETGAGKSFILKALGFVLGEKLNADIVRPGAERAQVEAQFILNGEELVLRRELLAASGRSRFYINDSLSSRESLGNLRNQLLSHTSQHAQQQLLQPAFQTRLLEKDFPAPDMLEKRGELLAKLKNIAANILELEKKQASLVEKRELLEMQKAEIDKVDPQAGEEEELENRRAEARAMDGAKQSYKKAMAVLHGDECPGILQLMQDLERILSQMCKIDESIQRDLDTVAACREQLAQISTSLPRPASGSEKIDMDAIEERLFALAQLKRRLKRTLPEILSLKDEIEENFSFLDVCALDLSRLKKERESVASQLKELVGAIMPLRLQTGENFAKKLEGELHDLGFSEHARVIPQFVEQEIWPGITDLSGSITWAPNPGQKPQPLDRIASGGELSRFLLGLSTMSSENDNITYIFDEVDAGVGGLTLNRVGEKLRQLARTHQVILITHWPQLAALAKKHFQISKMVKDDQTFTLCVPLTQKQRSEELARMAGGGREGETYAKILL